MNETLVTRIVDRWVLDGFINGGSPDDVAAARGLARLAIEQVEEWFIEGIDRAPDGS